MFVYVAMCGLWIDSAGVSDTRTSESRNVTTVLTRLAPIDNWHVTRDRERHMTAHRESSRYKQVRSCKRDQ